MPRRKNKHKKGAKQKVTANNQKQAPKESLRTRLRDWFAIAVSIGTIIRWILEWINSSNNK